jgi:hypothetical protein
MRVVDDRPDRWVRVAIAWAAIVCGAAPSPARCESPAAVLTVDQVRQFVDESQSRLRSLWIVYRAEPGPDSPPPDPGESAFSRHKFAARGPLRFTEDEHWGDGVTVELDLNHHMGFFSGGSLDVFYINTRYFETTHRWAQAPYSLKVRSPIIMECLGWWPPDDTTEFPSVEPVIIYRRALANKDFVIAPRQEQVDGAWCHVLERPGADKLWIDPAAGFGVRRREVRLGPAGNNRAVRYESSDFREVEPRIWLPWRMRRLIYDPAGDPLGHTSRSIAVKDAVCTVEQVEVNRVSEQLFHFDPPPGTFVKNMDDQSTRQIPGGRDFLEQIVAQARELPRLYAGASAPRRTNDSPTWPGYALVAAVALLAAIDIRIIVLGLRTR